MPHNLPAEHLLHGQIKTTGTGEQRTDPPTHRWTPQSSLLGVARWRSAPATSTTWATPKFPRCPWTRPRSRTRQPPTPRSCSYLASRRLSSSCSSGPCPHTHSCMAALRVSLEGVVAAADAAAGATRRHKHMPRIGEAAPLAAAQHRHRGGLHPLPDQPPELVGVVPVGLDNPVAFPAQSQSVRGAVGVRGFAAAHAAGPAVMHLHRFGSPAPFTPAASAGQNRLPHRFREAGHLTRCKLGRKPWQVHGLL